MALITIKNKYQIVIPVKIRKELSLRVGDLLEATVEKGKITLSPKIMIDRDIAESLDDFKKGRTHGPFTHKELVTVLKKEVNKLRGIK